MWTEVIMPLHVLINHPRSCNVGFWKLFKWKVKKVLFHSFWEIEMVQRTLVIQPPFLLLLPLSCLLNLFFFLPQLFPSEVLPSPPPSPPRRTIPSCENISSPISPSDLSLWQMLRPLLSTLEVQRICLLILVKLLEFAVPPLLTHYSSDTKISDSLIF